MILELAVVASLAVPPRPVPGPDKVKHFFASAFVHSVTYSALRAAGASRSASQAGGAGVTLAVGTWKELRDRRAGGPFSGSDLAWDAAGLLAAGALLNGTR